MILITGGAGYSGSVTVELLRERGGNTRRQARSKAEIARELAYRLYTLCERKKRPAEALAYNGLVQSWPEITRLTREGARETQQEMFE